MVKHLLCAHYHNKTCYCIKKKHRFWWKQAVLGDPQADLFLQHHHELQGTVQTWRYLYNVNS